MTASPTRCATALALTLAFAACDSPQAVQRHDHSPAFAVGGGQLGDTGKQVLQATSRFNSLQQAAAAGYVEASPCIAVPGLGGMGFHYVNETLVDPVFNPLQPESLVYEPARNGQLKLVAVEYIVIDVGQPAPTFDGQPFDVGGTPVPVAHWSLHVWIAKPNSNGLYAPFNPAVVCP